MKTKKAVIISLFIAVILSWSACGKTINLSSPELIRKDRIVEDIYNNKSDYALVLGIEENPWIVSKPLNDILFTTNSVNGNELLVYSNDKETDTGVLIYKTLEKEIRIENVDRYGCSLSADGKIFTYVIKDSETDENVLYVVKDNDTKELLRGFNYCLVSLSPNGSAIGISIFSNMGDIYFDRVLESYIVINNEIINLDYNVNFLRISDNFEYIYYILNGKVYMQKGLDRDSRKKLFNFPHETSNYIAFNSDNTQAYYGVVDWRKESTYLLIDGGKPVKIAEVATRYNNYDYDNWGQPIDFSTGLWYSSEYDEGSVKYTLYAFDENMKLREIAPAVMQYTVLPDKKLCYYTKDDVLYRLDLSGGEPKPEIIASNVVSFECDGDIVFCINKHNTNLGDDNREEIIFSVDQNGNEQTITKNFDAYSVCGDELYYLDDLSVYRSIGGVGELMGKIELSFPETNISEINMEATYSGYVIMKFWEKDSDSETYISKNGEEFVNIESLK
jgi:hypothetical protein